MIIEVPKDLSKCSRAQLLELEEQLDDARTAVRVEMRVTSYDQPRPPNYANRPAWTRAVASLIDGPARKKADRIVLVLAILIVSMFTLPGVLNTLIEFSSRYQATHYQGVPKPEPTAPTISGDQQ